MILPSPGFPELSKFEAPLAPEPQAKCAKTVSAYKSPNVGAELEEAFINPAVVDENGTFIFTLEDHLKNEDVTFYLQAIDELGYTLVF